MKGIKTLGLVALLALALIVLPSTASAAGKGTFKAGAYPATLNGTGTWGIHFESPPTGSLECEPTTTTGELSKQSETMTLSSSQPKCWPTGHEENGFKRTLTMNGCGFILHAPDPTKSATTTFDIGGAKCGEMFLEGPFCWVWIPPQQGSFSEVWSAPVGGLEVYPQATNLKYSVWCGGAKETRTDGKLSVAWLVKATNAGKETSLSVASYPGLSVIGEGAGKKFHSDYYPVYLAGEQIGGEVEGKWYEKLELVTGAGTLKCTPVKFSSLVSMSSDSSELSLEAAYGLGSKGCTFSGAGPVTVTPESGCHFGFAASGQLSTCKISISVGSCFVAIPAQVHSGLTLTNVGAGWEAYVKATVNLSAFQYQVEGSGCPKEKAPGSYSDGTYKGTIKLNVNSL